MAKGLDKGAGLIPTNPTLSDLNGVMSVELDNIKLAKLAAPVTSQGIIDTVAKFGMTYSEIGIKLFRETKFGKPARKDNLELIDGYPFYGQGEPGLSNLRQVLSDISSFKDDFMSDMEKSNAVMFDMEDEDFSKFNIQRRTYPGRHLMPPISLDFQAVNYPVDFVQMLSRVVDHYVKANAYQKTGRAAILDGTDAKDTALGSPTFYAGDNFHAARLATLSAMPVPDYSVPAASYLDKLEQFAGTFFPDPSLIYASYLSYRYGATKKPIPLFSHTGLGYSADKTAEFLYPRMRAVWAAPFPINVIATPLVLRMKSSRQNILGMWHDPANQAVYIPKLQSQGKKSYEIDYSGYDTTISNELMYMVYDMLAKKGYAPWEADFMAELTLRQGAITPSFLGVTDSVSYFRHNVTLMSGLLPTSELGSIISRTIVLYCLSKQHPDLVERAFSGNFVILVQSDDVLFTTDKDIDIDQFKASAAKLGIIAKVKAGSTFLKHFLPVGTVSKRSKPFSRNVQQTCGNEDNGNGKPNAIHKLGLGARLIGLNGHPLFSKYWPRLFGIYEAHFDYVKEIEHKKEWLQGTPMLTHGDIRAIQQYAESTSGDSVMTNLLERAAFDPSAAAVIAFLKEKGLALDFLEADQIRARSEYTKALFTPPGPDDLFNLLSFARWNT